MSRAPIVDAGEIEAAGAGEAILVVALVEARVLEADAEAVERLVHLLERVRDDGGRVEAAAQVRGDGDVGPQAQARGVSEQRIQLVRQPGALGRRHVAGVREAEVPPPPLLADAVGADAEVVGGGELPDAWERRARPARCTRW